MSGRAWRAGWTLGLLGAEREVNRRYGVGKVRRTRRDSEDATVFVGKVTGMIAGRAGL